MARVKIDFRLIEDIKVLYDIGLDIPFVASAFNISYDSARKIIKRGD